jgi:ABC-type amino acid transport substrate-binding protein
VVNIMLHMPLDPELSLRNDMVVMGGAYASEKTILAWSKTALGDVPTMTDFTEYKIAVENDSIADFYLGSFAGGGIIKNILHRKDIAAAAQELVSGEAAGLMGPLSQIEFELNKAGEKRSQFGVGKITPPGLAQGNWKYGFAVRMNYRDLFYATEDAIVTAVADGRVEKAFAKFGLTYSPPPAPEE